MLLLSSSRLDISELHNDSCRPFTLWVLPPRRLLFVFFKCYHPSILFLLRGVLLSRRLYYLSCLLQQTSAILLSRDSCSRYDCTTVMFFFSTDGGCCVMEMFSLRFRVYGALFIPLLDFLVTASVCRRCRWTTISWSGTTSSPVPRGRHTRVGTTMGNSSSPPRSDMDFGSYNRVFRFTYAWVSVHTIVSYGSRNRGPL